MKIRIELKFDIPGWLWKGGDQVVRRVPGSMSHAASPPPPITKYYVGKALLVSSPSSESGIGWSHGRTLDPTVAMESATGLKGVMAWLRGGPVPRF